MKRWYVLQCIGKEEVVCTVVYRKWRVAWMSLVLGKPHCLLTAPFGAWSSFCHSYLKSRARVTPAVFLQLSWIVRIGPCYGSLIWVWFFGTLPQHGPCCGSRCIWGTRLPLGIPWRGDHIFRIWSSPLRQGVHASGPPVLGVSGSSSGSPWRWPCPSCSSPFFHVPLRCCCSPSMMVSSGCCLVWACCLWSFVLSQKN